MIARSCLELLVGFAYSLAIWFLPPVVTVLSEEPDSFPVEQEDRPSCASSLWFLKKVSQQRKLTDKTGLTSWQPGGIVRDLDSELAVVQQQVPDLRVLQPAH